MILSKLNVIPTTRDTIDVFGGYNHNLRIREGDFYDMKNLTSADYPVLSPRPRRGVYSPGNEASTPQNPLGMIAKDALCYVEANADGKTSTFYINGYPITFEGNETLNAEPKTLISMGSYVIIMPDKYYINTNDYSDKGKIEKTYTAYLGHVQFNLCKLDGEGYNIEYKGDTAPALPEGKEEHDDLTLWLDTSGETHVLKQYSKTNSQWVSVATTYIKISFPGSENLKDYFAAEDGLTIEGLENVLRFFTDIDENIKEQLKLLEGTMVAYAVEKNYIIVKGILDQAVTITLDPDTTPRIYIKRQMPIMDYVIESGNRLWGCRYGTALNGKVVNEIYASKLGDFKNWNTFAGISTDSYVASVGTDGQFTGAITHLGYPLFFKENYVHKVYGYYPANYQIQTTACRGVQKGCSKSLAIVNETVYYKSRSAVCAYDGSLPVEISAALGDVSYSNATAGVLGNKYYISMKDAENKYHLFVYDAQKGMWHREDNTQANEFCNCDGELYYIDYDTKQIKTVRGSGTPDTTPIKWEATTGIIGIDYPDRKYLSRIVMRLSLEVGTRLYVQVQYDSSGTWEQIFAMSSSNLKAFSIPIRPKRCDHLRLRFIGEGEGKIFSLTKTLEQGSDA
jgi:hypothetical protein